MNKHEIEAVYALTPAQQGILSFSEFLKALGKKESFLRDLM